MRRNDLTSDEMRFERLLRSLDRGPSAPDPEFLRQLKETSTAAFLAARPAQPRAARKSNDPPPNPAVGRRRLRALRVAIFSSVAALLFVGMLSPALFPSRGIELGVALDNLKRASSYEIEFQNGAGSNTLLFVRGDDAALHWRRDYASGNAEVSDGISTYFVNRGNNSVHPSPLEEETIAPTFVEDRLMAGLNLNDPAVQSSLMKQRPETKLTQNGRPVLVYNYQAPDKEHAGQTLTVNATVNADNNTLLAINSEVLDANGNSKFKANADVKSVNSTIPIDRFQIDPMAEPSEQIAMVEDVQGQAVVDDLTPLPAMNQAVDGIALPAEITELRNRAANGLAYNTRQLRSNTLDAYQETGPEAAASAAPVESEKLLAEPQVEKRIEQLKQKRAMVAKAYTAATPKMPSALPQGPPGGRGGLGGLGLPQGEAGADKARDGDSKADALAGVVGQGGIAGQGRMKGSKSPGGMGGGGGLPAGVSAKKLATDRNELDLAAKDAAPTPPTAPAAAGAAVARRMSRNEGLSQSDVAEAAKAEVAKPGQAVGQKAALQTGAPQGNLGQLKVAQNAAVADSKTLMGRSAGASESNRKSGKAGVGSGTPKQSFGDLETELMERQSPAGEPTSGEEKKQLAKGQIQEKRTADLADTTANQGLASQYGQPAVKLGMAANTSQYGVSNRLGEYGFVRRQVEVQSELHPGGVLKTDADPSNVVWARLANDADLVVGPGSEVLLLKPTEVRLQAGELMLNVPPGDQVDLLGPDLAPPVDAENSRFNYRRNPQQLKVAVSRQQVTGRGVFRIENNQLQRVEQEPPWLARYFSKQNTAKQNSQSLTRQPSSSRTTTIESSGKSGMRPESATQQGAPRPK